VDHRVEPQSWLPGRAAGDQDPATDGAQDNGQPVLASPAASGELSSPAGDAGPALDATRMPPPFPAAAVPEPAAGPVTSSFGTITSPGNAQKKPAKPPRAPKAPKAGKAKVQVARQAQNGALPARRAQFAVTRVEPWSVMKFSFVAVAGLYYFLSRLGVFQSIEKSVSDVTSSKGSAGVKASTWFSASRVLGYTMLIGAVNVILITALATVGSVIYNLVTHVAGGIEVTLRDTD